MKKILVLRGGALGDFIVTLPALAQLRARWPEAEITLVGNATAATLGRDAGLIDHVESQHAARWAGLYGSAPLSEDLAGQLTAFDLVINYWPDPDGELSRRFPLHEKQIVLSAAAMPTTAPAAAHYCSPLNFFGLSPGPLWYALGTPKPDARLIALHPGSGSRHKNWPLAHWAELCAWITQELRAELLIITGEADEGAATTLAKFGHSAHSLPLAQLVDRLGDCRLFIGHDSGISHLAAACSVPSLLLFGPTDPAMWAPPAPRNTVIRKGAALDSISLARVQQAVRTALAAGR